MGNGHSKIKTGRDARPGYEGMRVRRIAWDSGFRDSGLRVGDRLVGEFGTPYTEEALHKGRILGGSSESSHLDDLGLEAGDSVALQVERDGRVLTVEGELTENRTTRDPEGRRSFGEDGPAEGEKDGFEYAWRPWYGQLDDLVETILLGWDYTVGYDTRRLAERLEPFRERVDFLEANYPGAFARATRHDFDAARETLAGEPRELTEEDLAYRQLGAIRAARVTEAADRAWEAFLAEMGDDLVADPFPAPTSFEEDFTPWVGKVARLPEIGDRDILFETKRSWYHFGRSQGVYVIPRQHDATRAYFRGADEYVEKVDPFLGRRRLSFVGVVEPEPALVSDVIKNLTVVALRVRPLGVLVTSQDEPGHRFFVDLRPEARDGEAFAGESEILAVGRPRLTPELTPAEVMGVFFDCLKLGDFDTWMSCFADWKVRSHYDREGSSQYVDRTWITLNEREAVSVWDNSRQELLEDVFGVEVAHVSPPETVYDAAQEPTAQLDDEPDPRTVERVRVLVHHIGRVDPEDESAGYRTFAGGQLHRKWTLERLDEGPWRVTSAQTL